jgi:ketosteroid isomerase-like protein
MPEPDPHAGVIADLVERSAEANSALLAGDIEGYFARMLPGGDFTLMSPFGGTPTHGAGDSPERVAALKSFFRTGSATLELVRAYASDSMVVLSVIERQRAAVGGLPEQDWSLRVTLVFRLEDGTWRLVHRHADPLVPGIDLRTCAALAAGNGLARPVG